MSAINQTYTFHAL